MNKTLISLSLVLLVAGGCRKKPPPTVADTVETASKDAQTDVPTSLEAAMQRMAEHFAKVHFEFDSSVLTQGSMDALAANARILQKHPSLTIEVQGHADERGTTDYNLALGQRRATAVTEYLVRMGVSSSRVRMVSFGEELPEDDASNEVAWSKNRRCEFRILSGAEGVEGSVTSR